MVVMPPGQKQKKPARVRSLHNGKNASSGLEAVSVVAASSASGGSTWSVSSTSQWQYPTSTVIHTAAQLKQLQQFLMGKVCFY
jgi:hypothetical protein